jgi:subtilisin family serine protease
MRYWRPIFFIFLTFAMAGTASAKTHFWDKLSVGKDYLSDEVVVQVVESKNSEAYWRAGKTWKEKVSRGQQTSEARQLMELAGQLGCRLLKKLGTLPFYEFKVVHPPASFASLKGAALVTALCEAFEEGPDLVKLAEPNGILEKSGYTPYAFPNDPYYQDGNTQWNLNITQLDEAWNTTTGGMSTWTQGDPTILIAVVDSGINTSHQDFAGRLVAGYNVLDGSSDVTDADGHGTAVASIASVDTNNSAGIAGGAVASKIMPVKFFQTGGGTEADAATGIDWAANNGASIINMSFAGTVDYTPLHTACDLAYYTFGAVLIAGSGNNGTSVPNYPQAYSSVVAVSATDNNDKWLNYSGYASYLACGSPSGVQACGISSASSYGGWGGTSMAGPGAAGLAAILVSNGVQFYECISRIAETCDKVDSSTNAYASDPGHPLGTWNQYMGYGRINFYRAMETLVPPTLNLATPGVGTVFLSWAAPTLFNTSTQGYIIYRSNTAGGPYAQIGTTISTSFTDPSAVGPSTLYYVVKAQDSNSFLTRYSNELSASPLYASPTNTPSFTATPTFSTSPTATGTPTPSPTYTATGTFTSTPSITSTGTPSPTFSVSPTPTPSFSVSPTRSPSPDLPGRQSKVVPYPNPFSSGKVWFAFPTGGTKVSVLVYTLAGERVIELGASQQQAQNGLVDWNGGGGKLASGLYMIVANVDGKRYLGKLAIIEPGYGGGLSLPGYLNSPH